MPTVTEYMIAQPVNLDGYWSSISLPTIVIRIVVSSVNGNVKSVDTSTPMTRLRYP